MKYSAFGAGTRWYIHEHTQAHTGMSKCFFLDPNMGCHTALFSRRASQVSSPSLTPHSPKLSLFHWAMVPLLKIKCKQTQNQNNKYKRHIKLYVTQQQKFQASPCHRASTWESGFHWFLQYTLYFKFLVKHVTSSPHIGLKCLGLKIPRMFFSWSTSTPTQNKIVPFATMQKYCAK